MNSAITVAMALNAMAVLGATRTPNAIRIHTAATKSAGRSTTIGTCDASTCLKPCSAAPRTMICAVSTNSGMAMRPAATKWFRFVLRIQRRTTAPNAPVITVRSKTCHGM